MKATARSAKTPSARTGSFATLRAFLGGEGSGAPAHRAIGTLAALLCAAAATLVLAAPASASTGYPQFGQILGPAPGANFGRLLPESVAVDDVNGHVYVADSSDGLVYDFSSPTDTSPTVWNGSTTPTGSFGGSILSVAVDNSSGDVYVADHTDKLIDKFDQNGNLIASFGDAGPTHDGQLTGSATPAGSFAPATGSSEGSINTFDATFDIAVDQATGDLYALDAGHQAIDVFSSSGAYLSQIQAAPNVSFSDLMNGLAVDDFNNRVFAYEGTNQGEGTIYVFSASGSYLETTAGSPGDNRGSVAVDDSTGDLYVARRNNARLDRYNAAGGLLDQTPLDPNVRGLGIQGIAVDQASGRLYLSGNDSNAGSAASRVVILGPLPITRPDPTTGAASEVTRTTAELSGTVNPNETEASFQFEYGLTKSYGHKAPGPPGAVGSDNTAHEVSTEVTGLEPSTTYHYRLDGVLPSGGFAPGEDATFHTAGPPNLDSQSVEQISSTAATVAAEINPSGFATTYQVRYGTTAAYGSESAALAIGAGSVDQSTSVQLSGLTAETTYHYRVVATNHCNPAEPAEVCRVESSEDKSFKTGPPLSIDSTSVSDVTTSAAALNAQIDPLGLPTTYHFEYLPEAQYNANGESFAGATVIPAPDAKVPAPLGIVVGGLVAGRAVLFAGTNIISGAFPVGATVTGPGIPPGTLIQGTFGQSGYRISAPATATVNEATFTVSAPVSQSIAGLSPETAYVYRVLATNSAALAAIVGPTRVFHTHPTGLDASLPDNRAYELVSPAVKDTGGGVVGLGLIEEVTADGAAITYPGEDFFQSPDGDSISQQYTSFAGPAGWSTRNTTGESREEAFAPLAPPALPPTPVLPAAATPAARVLEQSADGSVVFFTDTGKLTPDSTAAPGEPDLYRYDVAGEQITDLSVDSGGQHADVQGVLGAGGEAGSYVYFVANGVLAPGASPGNCSPFEAVATAPGTACNLYLSHAGATTFIAGLSALDNELGRGGVPSEARDWTPNRAGRTAEVSPDGRYLAFGATDHALAPQLGAFLGPQLFRYGAATNSLLCASCNPDGSTSGALYFPQGANAQPKRYLTNDGRLLFNDLGALSPRDVNGRADVYEFEDQGVGSCQTPGGCRSLISGGGGTGDSLLAAITGEGSDVFFTTSQRLSSEDRDEARDMYDARIDGREPPAAEIPCETAEACHGKATAPAPEQTAGSATFHGPGNPVEKPCKKGFIKKGTKCVKKPSKHHKHKKHHQRAASHNSGGGK